MNLEAATARIETCMQRMDASYGRPVFDEWAVATIGRGSVDVHAYRGPREGEFADHVLDDLVDLREEISAAGDSTGEFSFSREARGSHIDAFIYLGAHAFLLCNNTRRTIAQVASDPLWLKAQTHFVSLSEAFQTDPLQFAGD